MVPRYNIVLKLYIILNWHKILSCNIILKWNILLRCYAVHTISFLTFFVWALLLIVRTWNSSPLRSNLPRLQCTCCTVPTTTSGRLHGILLCDRVNNLGHTFYHLLNCLITTAYELRESQKVTGSKVWTIGRVTKDKDGVEDWCIVLLEMPLTRFEES